jgi:serine/threonine-protein kinase
MSSTHRDRFHEYLVRGAPSAGSGAHEIDYALVIRRIRILAASLVAGLLFEIVIGLIIQRLVPEFFDNQRAAGLPPLLAVAALSVLVPVVLGIARIPQSARVAIGIFYVLAVAALIAASEVMVPWWVDGDRLQGMPWTAMWLLLVPVVVPLGSHRGVGRSFTLSIIPVLVMFAGVRWFGLPNAPVTAYLDLYVPCLIASALAVIVARMMYRLTRQVHEARMMGSYQLEEKIGAGGMGEVWRARHQMLVRPAAVKLIRPEHMARVVGTESDSAISRFKREAQATASLRSPHTVELYDFGVAEDGTFFYVMELLDGLDLAAFVQRFGPMKAERVIYVLSQACDSLADAHAGGLVHRDIKPANIFVCRMGIRTDFVKVLDFGLVKSLVTEQADLTLTGDQVVLGTPAFLAPEAAAGQAADPKSDIYSLGCVAYWLLTGTFVFECETPLAMAVAHAKDTPAPPSRKAERAIPEALDRIVLDCLAKSPADRPRSVEDLSRRLNECQSATPWTDRSAHEWWELHLPPVRPPGESAAPAAAQRSSRSVPDTAPPRS